MKILIVVHHRFDLWSPPGWFTDRLRRDFPGIEVQQFRDYEQAEPHLPDTDILVSWSLRPEQYREARKLRWIHSPAAAVHGLMIPEVIASDIVITNASDVHGPVVAEHAMALVMAMARRLPSAMRYQQRHVWAQDALWEELPRPCELSGASLGLIGVGAIGRHIARLALAFGMKLSAVREHPERGSDFLSGADAASGLSEVKVFGFEEMDDVVADSDFLVLAAPVTPKTNCLMDAARISRMKPNAYLINVGRGALIDEMALIRALCERRIGGAALDVFEHEPLPSESGLWELPNVLITPHSAGFTEKLWERHYALFSENLRRYIAGRPLTAIVNKQKGY